HGSIRVQPPDLAGIVVASPEDGDVVDRAVCGEAIVGRRSAEAGHVGEPLSRPRIPGEDLPSGSTAVVDDQRAASAGAAQSPAPPRRAPRHLDVLLRSPRGTHGPRAVWRMRPDAVSLGPDPELAKIENAGPGIDRVVFVTVAEGQWQAPGERLGIRRG